MISQQTIENNSRGRAQYDMKQNTIQFSKGLRKEKEAMFRKFRNV